MSFWSVMKTAFTAILVFSTSFAGDPDPSNPPTPNKCPGLEQTHRIETAKRWPRHNPSKAGPYLMGEIQEYAARGHRFGLDGSLDLRPHGEILETGLFPAGQSYCDVELHFKPANISRIADQLAAGVNVPREELVRILTENAARRMVLVSQILPESLRSVLGTPGDHPLNDCFGASFNVHAPSRFEWTSQGTALADFRQRHVQDLESGAILRFGDILEIKLVYPPLQPGQTYQVFTIHMATYLGKDFIFHKYGPTPLAPYEFHTAEGLNRFYSMARENHLLLRPDLPRRWDFEVVLNFARWRRGA